MHACIRSEESPGPENGVSKVPVTVVVVGGGGKKRYGEHGLFQGTKGQPMWPKHEA